MKTFLAFTTGLLGGILLALTGVAWARMDDEKETENICNEEEA